MEILIFGTSKTSDGLKASLVRRRLNSSLALGDFAQGMQIDPEAFTRWIAKCRKAASAVAGPSKRRREDRAALVKLDRKSLLSSCRNCEEARVSEVMDTVYYSFSRGRERRPEGDEERVSWNGGWRQNAEGEGDGRPRLCLPWAHA